MSTDYATKNRWQNRARWWMAAQINRLPRTCWARLVDWALHRRPLLDRYGDDVRQDSMCRRDALACGRCYCGKLDAADVGEQ